MNKKKQIILSEKHPSIIEAIGITCSESEFQLTNLVNTHLGIKLTIAPLISKTVKEVQTNFPSFYFDNEDDLEIRLVKNKVNNQILFPSQQIFDFLAFFKGRENHSLLTQFLSKLKPLHEITLVSRLEVKKVAKAKELNQLF